MSSKIAATLGLTVVFAALFVLVRDGVRPGLPFPEAPPFQLQTLDGRPVRLEDYRGSVVLVNFWATFCLPCVEEMPSLERLWQQHRADGLVVLGLSVDEGVDEVRKFQADHTLSFPIAHDSGKAIATSWGTEKVPETYVISRSGEVRTKVMGAVDWTSKESESMVAGLLAERS